MRRLQTAAELSVRNSIRKISNVKNIVFLVVAALAFAVFSATMLGINISGAAGIGHVIGSASATVGIALVLAFIPAGVYWLFKRKRMPGLNVVILCEAIAISNNAFQLMVFK